MDIGTLLFANNGIDLKSQTNTSGTDSFSKTMSKNSTLFSTALQSINGNSSDSNQIEDLEQTLNQLTQSQLLSIVVPVPQEIVEEIEPEIEEPVLKEEQKNVDIKIVEKQADDSLKSLTEKATSILATLKQVVDEKSTNKTENANDSKNVKDLFGDKLTVVKTETTPVKMDSAQNFSKAIASIKDAMQDFSEENMQNNQAFGEKKEQPEQKTNTLSTEKPVQNQATDFKLKNPSEEKITTTNETSTSTSNVGLANITREVGTQKIDAPKQPVALDDVKELVDNLVKQARLTQTPGTSEMIIRLRPQHLGDMTIRIMTESSGSVTASFHSNNPEVRALIQESLPAIRQELSNSGLKVNDVGVYAGLGSFDQQQHQNQGKYDEQGDNVRILSDEEKQLLEELQALQGENQSNIDGGVDYRV